MKEIKFCLFHFFGLFLFSQSILAQADFNKLDDKGKKQGVWKGFYTESKRPKYEGTFDHGKETGIFYFYDDTKAKSIIATREFNNNDNSAYTIFYDQKKNKVSEGKIVNRLNEGEWKYYHEASKAVMSIENYKNGKLDGLRSVFYPDKTIAEETHYVNGVKEGSYKKYTIKGDILEVANFKNGQYDGPAVFKDPDGSIVAKGIFVNGKKVGNWQVKEDKTVVTKNMNKPGKHFKPRVIKK